jgi:hypothetical protein
MFLHINKLLIKNKFITEIDLSKNKFIDSDQIGQINNLLLKNKSFYTKTKESIEFFLNKFTDFYSRKEVKLSILDEIRYFKYFETCHKDLFNKIFNTILENTEKQKDIKLNALLKSIQCYVYQNFVELSAIYTNNDRLPLIENTKQTHKSIINSYSEVSFVKNKCQKTVHNDKNESDIEQKPLFEINDIMSIVDEFLGPNCLHNIKLQEKQELTGDNMESTVDNQVDLS